MIDVTYQQLTRNKMFIIDTSDGEKKLPFTVLNTSDIYANKNDKKKFLFFNSIYIKPIYNFMLTDIGYSPLEKLELRNVEEKNVYFYLPSFNYTFVLKFWSDSTIFDARSYFSIEFFTIPQNIFIQYQKQQLPDDKYIFDFENSKDSPFIILPKEGYQLYYTYMVHFLFICMKSNSTLKNLKDSISSNCMLYSGVNFGEHIKDYFKTDNQIAIENSKQTLNEISKEIKIFDFNYTDSENGKKVNLKIKLYVEKDKKPVSLTISEITSNSTVYLVTCILEKLFQIDRSYFIPYGKHIDLNSLISDQKNLSFELKKTLKVKINNKIFEMSYLTTIENIKQIFKFQDNNFGIIINKHFINRPTTYLTQYLTNSDDPSKASEIILKYAITPCHIQSFTNKKERKVKRFVVPDCLSIEKVLDLYLHLDIDAVYIKKKGTNKKTKDIDYEYQVKDKRNVELIFIDESNKSSEMTVEVKGQEPRVIDLLQAVSDKLYLSNLFFKFFRIISFSNSNTQDFYEAYMNQQKLPFMMPLSSIEYNKNNKITVKKYVININNDTTFKIHNFVDDSSTNIQYENLSANEIIDKFVKQQQINCSNVKIFMEFNELKQNDHPLMCKLGEQCFLVFNEIKEKKNLIISNGTILKVTTTISSVNYSLISDIIIGMFNIVDFNDLQFYFYNGQNEYRLPRNFNAGALPDNHVIMIKYAYKKSDYITLFFEGKIRKIKLSNADTQIQLLKPEIQKKIEAYKISSKSMCFTFYECPLDETKNFIDYKIPEDALITVCPSKNSLSITVKLPEKIKNEYKILPSENASDLKSQIKFHYNYDEEFDIEIEKGHKMLDDDKFKPDMIVTLKCKKKKIKSKGSIGEKNYLISEILTVKEAKTFLSDKLKVKNISIFTFNKLNEFYEQVDPTKRLFEIDSDLFVHKLFKLDSIKFEDQDIKMNFFDNFYISECNTLKWLKINFIAKKILAHPNQFCLTYSNDKLNETETIEESFRVKPIYIKFLSKDEIDNQSTELLEPTKKPCTTSLRKPSINDDDDDDDEYSSKDSNNKVEEEEDEEEESEMGEKLITYKIQILDEPITTIKLKESATVGDAKNKIAEEKNTNPYSISILFYGTLLKKNTIIKDLEVKNDDIFYVYIRSEEDIFISTAKALRVYGQGDVDEYYSEYEEDSLEYNEEDNEKKDEEEIFSNQKNCEFKSCFISASLIDKLHREKIGRGASSEVFKVSIEKYPKNFLALKELDLFIQQEDDDANDDDDDNDDNDDKKPAKHFQLDVKKMRRFLQEFDVLNHIDHPNIIKTRGFFIGDETHPPSILLEYCPFNLKMVIKKLKNDEIVRIIIEICEAMKKIHELNIIHRDLKPENILIDSNKNVKITDFGICTFIKLDAETISRTEFAGTLAFMAPELLNKQTNYDEKVDVFSFGVILYWILTKGNLPTASFVEIAKGVQPEIPKSITDFSSKIITRCWSFDPAKRPSFKEICKAIRENKKIIV